MIHPIRACRHTLAVLAFLAPAVAGLGLAHAQSVAMTGGMGSRALLIIDGAPPKALAAGDTHKGVKVVSVASDQAVVEVGGQRQTVRLGGAPVSVGRGGGASAGAGGAGRGGTQIVLTAGSGGHFLTQGSINGRAVSFMVDTGATSIALGVEEARRIGLKFENGQRMMGQTANGVVTAYRVTLHSVRIQDVEVYNVEAAVLPGSMSHILLGNSFLTRFQMKRDNDQMTLTKRF